MSNIKAYKIDWIDSCSSNVEWSLIKDFEGDIEPVRITTYGVIIQKTKECITVAQNYSANPEQVSSLMTIPKGCIKKIVELKDE